MNALIVGVSKDPLKSHQKFKEKYQLNFPLLSDETGEVCQKYGVWAQKSLYGKTYFGIERSTFLINPQGKIIALWRRVKVNGHEAAVREALEKIELKIAP